MRGFKGILLCEGLGLWFRFRVPLQGYYEVLCRDTNTY